MHILVLNCGSSSLKYQLIETDRELIASDSDKRLAQGSIERIGEQDSKISYQLGDGEKEHQNASVPSHKEAIQLAFDRLTAKGGAISDPKEIEAVGHRIVHGGDVFSESALIDAEVLSKIEAVSNLAPLHNPHNLKGYYASREMLPDAKQVAVFDTSFHQTLPPRAYLYGIPYELYEREKIRRYGFHGTSHRYISWRYAKLHNTTRSTLKLISCHLGNGCSICAIDRGKSIDTSMGFTPTEGLLMGTRPGDIDPGAVTFLAERDPQGAKGTETLLNKRSGLAGLAGGSGDMRDLLDRREKGDERARDAIDVFCYRLIKYIGAYIAVLDGADAVLFAGGIGENAAPIRDQVCEGLRFFGLEFDKLANASANGKATRITEINSGLPAWVIPTDEELVIARDTFRVIHGLQHP